jgi:hypothetical protein
MIKITLKQSLWPFLRELPMNFFVPLLTVFACRCLIPALGNLFVSLGLKMEIAGIALVGINGKSLVRYIKGNEAYMPL